MKTMYGSVFAICAAVVESRAPVLSQRNKDEKWERDIGSWQCFSDLQVKINYGES